MTKQSSGAKDMGKQPSFKNLLRPFREWFNSTPSSQSSNNSNSSSSIVTTHNIVHNSPSLQMQLQQQLQEQQQQQQQHQLQQQQQQQQQQQKQQQHQHEQQQKQQQHQNEQQQKQQQQQQEQQQQQMHFKRSTTARMSLPIMQQNLLRRQAYSQLQRRGPFQPQSLGHIYLQHNGETKQANLPNELTTLDTIRALFVCAFPNILTMEYMSQLHVKIYVYNPNCNIFYELRDIGDVKHESVLRIHQSDPILALRSAAVTPQPYHQYHHHQALLNQHHHLYQQPTPTPPLHDQSPYAAVVHHQQQQQQQQQHQTPIPGGIPPPKPRRMVFLPSY